MSARQQVDTLMSDPERVPFVLGWLASILDGSSGFPARPVTAADFAQAVESSARLAGGAA